MAFFDRVSEWREVQAFFRLQESVFLSRFFLARTPMNRPLFVPHPNDMQMEMLARREAMAQAVGGWGCGVQGSDD